MSIHRYTVLKCYPGTVVKGPGRSEEEMRLVSLDTHMCDHDRAAQRDAYCRDCGAPLPSRRSSLVPPERGGVGGGGATRGRGTLVALGLLSMCLMMFAGLGFVSSHESSSHGNAGLWHRVGELFNREQIRQRKIKHGKADAVENGPKEISIFCPQDPTIKIVELNEDERNRDECLVLNIAAPDVSSRLVLFCNAHSLDEEDGEEDYDDLGGEGMHSDEM
jgi:hypothetical protein